MLLAEVYMDTMLNSNDIFTKREEVIETAKSKRVLSRVVLKLALVSKSRLTTFRINKILF